MARDVSINFDLGKAARRAVKIHGDYIDDIARIQVDEMQKGFISGTDVHGRKYTPSIVDRRPIRLFKTGEMRDGIHVSTFTKPTSPMSATITSGSRSRNRAKAHNDGLKPMPERQFFIKKKLIGLGRVERRRQITIKRLLDVRK